MLAHPAASTFDKQNVNILGNQKLLSIQAPSLCDTWF